MPVPTIALVRGPAVGGGLDLSCACDLVVASTTARFMVAYTRRGLFPDLGGFWLLPQVVGYRKAADLVFTGRFVEAEEALAIGLATRLVDDETCEEATRALAEEIATRPPIALRLGKLPHAAHRLDGAGDGLRDGCDGHHDHRDLRRLPRGGERLPREARAAVPRALTNRTTHH